ncbi:Beta-galactosidase [Anaerohalosphaera lusitana]|uniref:beta-galactosidase n=1 Tax=Anaerohalosphaera lusitana TaxID=1936003 RepID=A0A1U9NNF7_9BACT|nr:discoidin domain-containing protein [Anaerohalosphaera lusitana]AQT69150.1 Beta-galactosidase [Anaerohalosphaera lusitana]
MKKLFVIFLIFACSGVFCFASVDRMNLSGQWKVQLQSRADQKTWDPHVQAQTVQLPGSLTENGLGENITMETEWTGGTQNSPWFTSDDYAKYRQEGRVKVPFWLTPVKYYVGPAWYQREFKIPDDWQGRYVYLNLERCHWETRVWLNGKEIGVQNSLGTPHRYSLGNLKPGKHTMTICVDNTVKIAVGDDAHSVSDHTQTNWNGIVGDIYLGSTDSVTIDDVQIYPDTDKRIASVKISLKNFANVKGNCRLKLSAHSATSGTSHTPDEINVPVNLTGQKEQIVEVTYKMGEDSLLWDEFSPNLYKMVTQIEGEDFSDSQDDTFGMREVTADQTQIAINGRKTFLRGTLECCIFPLTGYPPTNVDAWKRIISICKEHGLNHIRFHSWCPPKAAFIAADEVGFFLQVECGAWATIGNGQPIDQFIYDEGDKILKEYGNHPSFIMMAYGNEPGGGNQKKYLAELVNYWKKKDDRRLYTSAAGWPLIPPNDFHSTPGPRIQAWGAGLRSRINAKAPETTTDYSNWVKRYDKPLVSHEIGQWCVFPNLEERKKYTGVTRAYNFDIFSDRLEENGLLDQAHDFLMASGKLQTICYKEDIESSLRTPGFGGFQLLDLHDFPGQGTALVGVLDPFWDEKGYVTAEEYHRFSCETVPLTRMEKRVWTSDENFKASVEIANYGPSPIEDADILWTVKSADARTFASGTFKGKHLKIGNTGMIGNISLPLTEIKDACKMNLEVTIAGTEYVNDWDFWIYPANISTQVPGQIYITDYLDEAAVAKLKKGGKVLLLPERGMPAGDELGKVKIGFSSIFWNTAWTRRQAPHTLGIICEPDHPALEVFPTDYYSDWQWWDIISKSDAMILNDLPPGLRPIVQVIDDWVTSRRLGLVFEAKLHAGKLLVCSADIQNVLQERPAARQLRASLLKYMNSGKFTPEIRITEDQIKGIFKSEKQLTKLRANVHADSEASQNPARNAFDDDPATIWHTPWGEIETDYPHHIEITLPKPTTVTGLRILPRQDSNSNGDIKTITVQLKADNNWQSIASLTELSSDDDWKTVEFGKTYTTAGIRIICLSPQTQNSPWASIAEIDLE